MKKNSADSIGKRKGKQMPGEFKAYSYKARYLKSVWSDPNNDCEREAH